MTTKAASKLTLRDKLSRLSFTQACKMLGPQGRQLIQLGGKVEINILQQVYFCGDLFQVKIPIDVHGNTANVSITLMAEARDRLHTNCTYCEGPCEHVGAALSLILEEKMTLGLAAPPRERVPIESLSEQALIAQAIADRAERAKTEKYRLTSSEPKTPWTEYTLTSNASGKTYHLSIYGSEPGEAFCSCPDFRTNTLGTCKHLIYAIDRIDARFPATQRHKYKPKTFSMRLHYTGEVHLRLNPPHAMDKVAKRIAGPLLDKNITDVAKLVRRVNRLESAGYHVAVHPDAGDYIDRVLFQRRIDGLVSEIRKDPAGHPLRKTLLTSELLPYQMDGIAFATGAGRAILADDMGLGKTIQGIGVAEMLAQHANIAKVLIICPTSLKSQWANEIHRFCHRSCQLVMGSARNAPSSISTTPSSRFATTNKFFATWRQSKRRRGI